MSIVSIESDSIESLPYSDEIEDEETALINVETLLEEESRSPRTKIGKAAEVLLQAIKSAISLGQSEESIFKTFEKMNYKDKQLTGFQQYFKSINEKVKERLSYDNADMIKKLSKLNQDNDTWNFYNTCQVAPLEELLKQKMTITIPTIEKYERLLSIKRLELQILNVYIGIHMPESNAIKLIQYIILVS